MHYHPQPPENQMLYKDEAPLEDARRLAELHIENDDILALTFLQEGRVLVAQFCFVSEQRYIYVHSSIWFFPSLNPAVTASV
jgi:hypothetical protein